MLRKLKTKYLLNKDLECWPLRATHQSSVHVQTFKYVPMLSSLDVDYDVKVVSVLLRFVLKRFLCYEFTKVNIGLPVLHQKPQPQPTVFNSSPCCSPLVYKCCSFIRVFPPHFIVRAAALTTKVSRLDYIPPKKK